MVPNRFDTFDQHPSHQFDAWREHYRKVFDLNLADGPQSAYPAEHVSWGIGGLTLTRASMPPHVARHWRHWKRPELDDWMLVVAPRATRTPGGRNAPSLTFRSLVRSFESYGTDGEVLSLFLPRDHFIEQASVFDSTQPRIPSSGMAALMADYLLSLEDRVRLLSGTELDRVAEVTRLMVTACVSPVAANLARASDTLSQTMVTRARKLIRQNLHLPGFGPSIVVRELGISRSVLYRAFQPHGGIAAVILQERLTEAHRRLATARPVPAIGDVALSLGFTDHSGFSRAFRQRFGYAPSEAIGLNRQQELADPEAY